MTEVKRLDPNANSFVANGVKYLISGDPLSIARFEVLERLQLEAEVGGTVKDLFNHVTKAMELANASKLGETYVELVNSRLGLSRIMEERPSQLLQICTLFIVKEGENVAEWTESEAIEKINDWKTDGYAMTDFFSLAVSLLPSFTPNYNADFQNILGQENQLQVVR
jgi:hypothetical protein